MPRPNQYRIVKLASGAHSIHSLEHAETFHPVVGPAKEAETLYVRQLKLLDRLRSTPGEFVVWDIGLGAAANPITFIEAARDVPCSIRIVSFDHTLEPLRFALQNTFHLPYLKGFEPQMKLLADTCVASFDAGSASVQWELHISDFPSLISGQAATGFPKPHAIMFDAFSPATNPAMWTQPLFRRIYALLDPQRPCALPTYSRSTLLRVTLLLAGFFVGIGHPTGEKEQTTIASNTLELLSDPLDHRWLQRAERSTSAEPMWEPVYRQAPLSADTMAKLRNHPQFQTSSTTSPDGRMRE